jgi:hypothetical protein
MINNTFPNTEISGLARTPPVAFFLFLLLEMKGRSLEELEIFEAKVQPGNSRTSSALRKMKLPLVCKKRLALWLEKRG